MENDVVCVQRQHNNFKAIVAIDDALTKEETPQLMGALPQSRMRATLVPPAQRSVEGR